MYWKSVDLLAFYSQLLMYEKLNVLEIGRLVGIVLAAIDVLFRLALLMQDGRSASKAVPKTLEDTSSQTDCFEGKHFKMWRKGNDQGSEIWGDKNHMS